MNKTLSKKELNQIWKYIQTEAEILGISEQDDCQVQFEIAPQYSFSFSGKTSQLELIRRMSQKIAKILPFSEKEIDDIGLAVDEACTNIIQHSYQKSATNSKIKIQYDLKPYQFLVTIIDQGKNGQLFPFWGKVNQTLQNKEFSSLEKRNFGVYLIQQLMDYIDYSILSGVSNQLVMVKYVRHH
ncbi:MAG: anti-sigma regulatory factor (Ser/Thr protein kinase) [bacterium]|jgi:anti-sigma regulatory factor (Ser/Thr protein kinase)